MKSLDELKEKQSQILLAELAGLLHNIGKLNSNFIHKCSDSSVNYKYDIALPASDFLPPVQCESLIRNHLGKELARLLCNENIWGAAASIAEQFGARLSGNATAVRGTREKINQVAQQILGVTSLSHQVAEVKNKLASAVKLAELCQNTAPAAYDDLDHLKKDGKQRAFLKDTELEILSAKVSLGELITLMWEQYHGFSNGQQLEPALEFWTHRNATLQRYLITAHGIISGIEKELPAGLQGTPQQLPPFAGTAYGYEPRRNRIKVGKIDRRRDIWLTQLIQLASSCLNAPTERKRIESRERIINGTRVYLLRGLGETQRPLNDLTLWDYVSTISTLFKAAIAKAVIENQFVETGDLRWRLLSIRYDGLEYLSRAHHISDLLARNDALEAALDEVKAVIEVEYPLGNEVYRDENGSVLIVPHLQEGDQPIKLLDQKCGDEETLESFLLKRFFEARYDEEKKREPLDGEVRPVIALSNEFLGKQIKLTESPAWSDPPLQPDPAKVTDWWRDENKRGEVCTVCGLRPQGGGAPDGIHPETKKKGWTLHLEEQHHLNAQPEKCEVCKAQDRQICWVCMERRDDLSRKWAGNFEGRLTRTIWTDEVADENGRLALVVGRFVLDGWLDGSLISTLQKSDSFARIQRCWRTTQGFWQEIEYKLPELAGGYQCARWKIAPDDPSSIDLGKHHVYDLESNGRHLSVVWDGRQFITADNLNYFVRTAALGDIGDWMASLKGRSLPLFEPSARLSGRERRASVKVKDVAEHEVRYSPVIPILAQPALFMALVPAGKAIDVAREIKHKYECEMSKVRDRLPIHIGLVFAPRRTPVRALLEAARRMLKMPERWENWEVQNASHSGNYHTVSFTNSALWKISAKMGDGATPDQWYPHLFSADPTAWLEGQKKSRKQSGYSPPPMPALIRACKLEGCRTDPSTNTKIPGSKVWILPSRFDFEFLDTARRRFEITYDDNGRRRGSTTRPFLLEDIDKLDQLWELLARTKKPLSTSHLQHLESMLTSYITDWFGGDIAKAAQCETYQKFAKDVLHRLDTGWWKSLDKQQQNCLDEAVTSGLILDLLDLRMHILKEKS